MEKRWCIIYIEKRWPGWLHSDPLRGQGGDLNFVLAHSAVSYSPLT